MIINDSRIPIVCSPSGNEKGCPTRLSGVSIESLVDGLSHNFLAFQISSKNLYKCHMLKESLLGTMITFYIFGFLYP